MNMAILKKTKRIGAGEERDRSAYQRAYYEKRSAELSEKRKRQYREDPAYREQALAQVRAYRRKQRAERERLRAAGKLPPPHVGGPRAPLRVLLNGVSTIAYTIGRAAVEVQRSKDTLNYWTRIGLLPQTPFRSVRGDRLYTEGMVLIMRIAIAKRARIAASDRAFYLEVRQGWEGLGVEIPRPTIR